MDEFEPGGALACNNHRVVVRMDQGEPVLRDQPIRRRPGFGHRFAEENHLGAIALGVPDLVEGRMLRHDNRGRDAEPRRVIGHSLRVIARRDRDHASFSRGIVKRKKLQKRAALLEAARSLHVLVFDEDTRSRERRKLRRFHSGRPQDGVLQPGCGQPDSGQAKQRLLAFDSRKGHSPRISFNVLKQEEMHGHMPFAYCAFKSRAASTAKYVRMPEAPARRKAIRLSSTQRSRLSQPFWKAPASIAYSPDT